jgi:hypothetical protein
LTRLPSIEKANQELSFKLSFVVDGYLVVENDGVKLGLLPRKIWLKIARVRKNLLRQFENRFDRSFFGKACFLEERDSFKSHPLTQNRR